MARYADGCDTPLGIIENRTPRAVVDDANERFRLKPLLRAYDEIESLFANREGRNAITFDFLREQLGLQNQS